MQDSGQPEDAGTARPEGAETEATRGTISRRRGRREFGATRRLGPKAKPEGEGMRGNPQLHREAHPEVRSSGATRGSSAGSTEGRDIRGNSEIRRRQSRKMQKPGQPGDSSAGLSESARLKGRRVGWAEGCEIRGNPMIHRRQGRKMKKPGRPGGLIERRDEWTEAEGQPGASLLGAPKDAKFEATRRSIAGRA
jgi:hypothetical protein